jgi:hypothetical protein
MKTRKHKKSRSTKRSTKQFLYNPNDPKRSFDVYINKNPDDTIPIRYKTLEDVTHTIHTLETLYKSKQYPHKRIWQVAMIMKVRLQVVRHKKPEQYALSKKYLDFLHKRTALDEHARYKTVFT